MVHLQSNISIVLCITEALFVVPLWSNKAFLQTHSISKTDIHGQLLHLSLHGTSRFIFQFLERWIPHMPLRATFANTFKLYRLVYATHTPSYASDVDAVATRSWKKSMILRRVSGKWCGDKQMMISNCIGSCESTLCVQPFLLSFSFCKHALPINYVCWMCFRFRITPQSERLQ